MPLAVGDRLEIGGVQVVVRAVGPLLIYERDKDGAEHQVVGGRFVHVERIHQGGSGVVKPSGLAPQSTPSGGSNAAHSISTAAEVAEE